MNTRLAVWSAALSAALLLPATSTVATPSVSIPPLNPIGGGYEPETLQGFAREVARQGRGPAVNIIVVPSAYGDAPEDREENLAQARARTTQVDEQCDVAVGGDARLDAAFPAGCQAELATLLNRADALDPRNSVGLRARSTDGVYFLGGDQVLAMQVLAGTPAEAAMSDGARHGLTFGGTSAGNAIESRSMGAGYPQNGYPWNAMERDKALIFWGDDVASDERGLKFGSRRLILDQHFHQRGRMGRLLNYTAQSVDRYGSGGKVGVGVDYGTGLAIEQDTQIGRPYGESSSAIVDFAKAKHKWSGSRDTITVRGGRVHLLAPGTGMTYNARTRVPTVDGRELPSWTPRPLPRIAWKGTEPLWLGGGQNNTAESAPMGELVQAGDQTRPLVVLAAGYPTQGESRSAAKGYAKAARAVGWKGKLRTLVHGKDSVSSKTLLRAGAVVFISGDQPSVAKALRDESLRKAVRTAAGAVPMLADGGAAAALGSRLVANADPEVGDEETAIAAYRTEYPQLTPGLGVVPGVLVEPSLTEGYRWGRLFTGAYAARAAGQGVTSMGVSELTALRIGRGAAEVVGERSVVAVDARKARWLPGSNGALGGVNIGLSAFGPGERVG